MTKIIDISHHQGDIDWSKASKEVSLAIIRTQYGTSTIDRKYIQNINGCKNHKIPFGVYIYVTFKNAAEALVQAKDFYNRAQKHNPLFFVVDVEESFGASVQNIVQGTQAFVDYLKGKGVKVGLYTGHHFYKPYRMDTIKNYDFLWIPRYSGTSAPGKKPNFACDLWQFTDKGIVQGITGPVDLNVLNGSKPLSWFVNIIVVDKAPKLNEKDDDKMKFTNSTTKAAVRDYLKQAVDKKLIDKSWLDKFDKGTLTGGDLEGLKIIIAQRENNKK
ncbi:MULTISPECIES: GH25 family lysozyme [Lysinibacillus]|uniref:GH25 family lysozyme n=1 Tax=Lysinibacillus TaxID=400634 RepID=UPI000A9A9D80|nr:MULTISPECIES: GH25 family lysozyme [Lysinibacillus]